MTPAVPFDREAFLRSLWAMDAALVAAGFPPTSPWWRAEIERFVRSGCRRWVIRAGRRAGKSTTLSRLAVAWAWFGPWSATPGDTPIVPFVSVSKDESAGRLRTITAILHALGLTFDARGEELRLCTERGDVLFKTYACTTSATVGFTSIAVFGDEVARWESRDTSADPAREVIGSLAPTLATQPFGFMALCSSPWSTDDYHATSFDAGSNDLQVASFAPTWIANPTITEKQTHELEPDPRIWQREYAAEPGATVSTALDAEDVAACFGRRVPAYLLGDAFVSIDASSLRNDAFTYIAGNASLSAEIVVREVDGWGDDDLRRVSIATIVDSIARRAHAFGVFEIFGDQREEAALSALFGQQGTRLTSFAWSEPSKDEAMQLLRRLMRERRVILPDHERLRRELTSMKARLLPSGRTRYETNGLDYASALVTLLHAIVAGNFWLVALEHDAGAEAEHAEILADAFEWDRRST